MTVGERSLIADSLLLIAVPAFVWWARRQTGSPLRLRFPGSQWLKPFHCSIIGLVLLAADLAYTYA